MGVMNCSRNSCNSIMCDTYIELFGYMCENCKKEFKQFLIDKDNINEKDMSKGEIFHELKLFNLSSKEDNKRMSIDEFLG